MAWAWPFDLARHRAYTSGPSGATSAVPLALTDGFRVAYLVGAGLVAAAAVVTFVFVRAPAAPGPAGHRLARWRAVVGLVVALFAGLSISASPNPRRPPSAPIPPRGPTLSFRPRASTRPVVHCRHAHSPRATLAPGYIMVANFYDLTTSPMVGQSGPLILNNDLQPVWFEPVPKDVVASNLTAQTYKGQPVLTWWQGVVSDTGATKAARTSSSTSTTRQIATIKGQDGWVMTLHELIISGDDAWVTANKDIPMNLSKYGGPSDGVLDDSAVQEYDIATGKLLYTWDALDHIPLTAAKTQPPPNGFPWDAYHVNSIELRLGSSDFLVSMRNTWAAYMVDAKNGQHRMAIGGQGLHFPSANRCFVRMAARRPNCTPVRIITMFDDNCCQITGAGTYLAPAGPSRALELKLNTSTHTATVVSAVRPRHNFSAAYMGDNQILPDGNVFVGWGSQPYFSEYTKSGKLVLDARFPYPDLSYRATLETGSAYRHPRRRVRPGLARAPQLFMPAGTGPPRFPRGGCWPAPQRTCPSWRTHRRPGSRPGSPSRATSMSSRYRRLTPRVTSSVRQNHLVDKRAK